jgi:hypothetical protein
LLEEVHEDVQSSLALELKKMRDKAQITIIGTERDKTQKEERVEACRRKQLGGTRRNVTSNRLGGMLLAIVGSN